MNNIYIKSRERKDKPGVMAHKFKIRDMLAILGEKGAARKTDAIVALCYVEENHTPNTAYFYLEHAYHMLSSGKSFKDVVLDLTT